MLVKTGDVVTYIDSRRKKHQSLVTCVFGTAEEKHPSLNIVYVSSDENREDSYGKQIVRETSVVHESVQPANANCWQ